MKTLRRRLQLQSYAGLCAEPDTTAANFTCGCCLMPEPTAAVAGSNQPPVLPEVAKLSQRVSRVLGRNPGAMSLTGTNIYLVGTGPQRILVDAGESKPGVLQDLIAVMEQEGCSSISQIIVTHWHFDHVMGVPELLSHFGPVPVRMFLPPEGTGAERFPPKGTGGSPLFASAFDPNKFLEDVTVTALADDEVVSCAGATLRALYTPGHANDHVSLLLEEEHALFTGDNVLGWGTGVMMDLSLYMQSLRRMRDVQPKILYPAHGPMIGEGDAGPWMNMYISHREERIQQVAKALNGAPGIGLGIKDITREVYKAQPGVLKDAVLFAGACNNSKGVLQYLQKEGKCIENGGLYSLSSSSRL